MVSGAVNPDPPLGRERRSVRPANPTAELDREALVRASAQLAGRILDTPVLRCDRLDAIAATRLWLKAENLQRGGSFKIRGALLAVDHLAAAGSRGIIAQSNGNHAIAVALAARRH